MAARKAGALCAGGLRRSLEGVMKNCLPSSYKSMFSIWPGDEGPQEEGTTPDTVRAGTGIETGRYLCGTGVRM